MRRHDRLIVWLTDRKIARQPLAEHVSRRKEDFLFSGMEDHTLEKVEGLEMLHTIFFIFAKKQFYCYSCLFHFFVG